MLRLPRDWVWDSWIAEDDSASETWRDPFVFKDAEGDGWHMLITARAKDAPRRRDGVLAHARSADMLTWELHPPLTQPAGFGQLEVPRFCIVDGQPVLIFTCHPEEQSAEQIAKFGPFSTWYVLGDAATGPWDIDAARPFEGDPKLFAAQLVQAAVIRSRTSELKASALAVLRGRGSAGCEPGASIR